MKEKMKKFCKENQEMILKVGITAITATAISTIFVLGMCTGDAIASWKMEAGLRTIMQKKPDVPLKDLEKAFLEVAELMSK